MKTEARLGTLPPGYSATMVQYVDSVDCGRSTAGIRSSAVSRFEVEDDAYYLYEVGGGKQFGLIVTAPVGQKVTFVLQGAYAADEMNGPPVYVRYDISADVFERALALTPEGDAVCISTPSD